MISIEAKCDKIICSDCNYYPNIPLTINIPTYKRYDLLKETLDSIAAQTADFNTFRVNVVDNDPEDIKTKQIVRGYPFCNYYRNAQNVGMYGNHNRIMEICDTPWCALLHDDDILTPHYVETALKLISEYSQYKLISFNGLIKNEITDSEFFTPSANVIKQIKPYEFIKGNPIIITGILINKQAWSDCGGFDQQYYPSVDYQLWSQIGTRYKAAKYSPQTPLTIYRISVNESTKTETTLDMLKSIDMTALELISQRPVFCRLIWKSYHRYSRYAWIQSAISQFHSSCSVDVIDSLKKRADIRYNIFNRIVFLVVNKFLSNFMN
ncbi:MAG: glycosyltransferase [Mucinivorans sp.]